MSYELIAPWFDKFQKMESMLKVFAEEDPPAPRLAAYSESFRRAVALWDADAPSRPRKKAIQQTRRLLKDCFLRILDVGLEALFLCTLSIGIWKLGVVKKKEEIL